PCAGSKRRPVNVPAGHHLTVVDFRIGQFENESDCETNCQDSYEAGSHSLAPSRAWTRCNSSAFSVDWASCKCTSLPLPGMHAVRYPLVEVGRAHGCLYPGKAHVLPDRVAHVRGGEAQTPVLEFLGQPE